MNRVVAELSGREPSLVVLGLAIFEQRKGFVKWFVASGRGQPASVPLADQPAELGLSFCTALRKTLLLSLRSLSFLQRPDVLVHQVIVSNHKTLNNPIRVNVLEIPNAVTAGMCVNAASITSPLL